MPAPDAPAQYLKLGNRSLDQSGAVVMGILNVTPDSFSDGGRYADTDAAVRHAEFMAEAGAHILDIGGESTRPGADPVGVQQEIDRVIPVIEAVHERIDVPLSIDTMKPEVMRAAVAAGAAMINDVNALRADGALETARDSAVPVCLMHMQGSPRTMQARPEYTDVVTEVGAYLSDRARACEAAGIDPTNIVLDPGFGFGKTLAHNLELLARLDELCALGYPVLAGLSRKSMIAKALNREVEERLAASLALAIEAYQRGARILRVHDVRETIDALNMIAAVREYD